MWWRFGLDIYYHPVMRLITTPTHPRDSQLGTREAIFLRIMAYCAEGHHFADATQLARFSAMPSRQCDIVWQLCVDNGILVRDSHGYTALPWMMEEGLCARVGRPRKSESRTDPEPEPTPEPTPKADAMPNKKTEVRPNVRLSEYELEQLKKEYSDADLNALLDHIDEYKRSSGRRYASDMDAIDRWGRRWLMDRKGHEVPDWIKETGDDKERG